MTVNHLCHKRKYFEYRFTRIYFVIVLLLWYQNTRLLGNYNNKEHEHYDDDVTETLQLVAAQLLLFVEVTQKNMRRARCR